MKSTCLPLTHVIIMWTTYEFILDGPRYFECVVYYSKRDYSCYIRYKMTKCWKVAHTNNWITLIIKKWKHFQKIISTNIAKETRCVCRLNVSTLRDNRLKTEICTLYGIIKTMIACYELLELIDWILKLDVHIRSTNRHEKRW